jgi:hypothetical protein
MVHATYWHGAIAHTKDPGEASLIDPGEASLIDHFGYTITGRLLAKKGHTTQPCKSTKRTCTGTRSSPRALRLDPDEIAAQQPPPGSKPLGEERREKSHARPIEATEAGALHPCGLDGGQDKPSQTAEKKLPWSRTRCRSNLRSCHCLHHGASTRRGGRRGSAKSTSPELQQRKTKTTRSSYTRSPPRPAGKKKPPRHPVCAFLPRRHDRPRKTPENHHPRRSQVLGPLFGAAGRRAT